MNSILLNDWQGEAPRIEAISHVMPSSPYLPLTGGCTTDKSLEKFIAELKRDMKRQSGHYYAYVWEHHGSSDEADIYALATWQVCPPIEGPYEAVVILYYAALNPYLTIKKHFGESSAQEYLERNAAISAIERVLG